MSATSRPPADDTELSHFPAPTLRGYSFAYHDGRPIVLESPHHGDSVNLTSGDIRLARMHDRVRHDTQSALAVAGVSIIDDQGNYVVERLYRSHQAQFFMIQVEWEGQGDGQGSISLAPVSDRDVFARIREWIVREDLLEFLRNWYVTGWLPRNDDAVQAWAEKELSADDCQALTTEMQQRTWSQPVVPDDW